MFDIIAIYGQATAVLIFGILGAVLTRFVWARITSDWARGLLERVYAEIVDAVLIVWQTYVSELKAHNADGKLTDEEKEEARGRAIGTVIDNLGDTGLKRLARVLGFVDDEKVSALDRTGNWLEDKTEAAVAGLKAAGLLGNGVRKGTYAMPAPVPPIVSSSVAPDPS